MTLGLAAGYEISSLPALTEAGVTSSVLTAGVNLCFQITVASIGTNVVIRLEGSLDDTNYFNLNQTETDFTLTSNGTYGYVLSGCPVQYVRVRLVSISGGTPSVTAKVGAA
jgi:hypothetical protein